MTTTPAPVTESQAGLRLRRHTLRALTVAELRQVAGGAGGAGQVRTSSGPSK